MSSALLRFERVMVTGAAGFVARVLLPSLAAALPHGARILRCVRQATPSTADQIPLDLTDVPAVDAAIDAFRPDLLINLAAQSSVGASENAANQTWRVNVDGSRTLAEAVARYVPRCAFFQASSAEVYGNSFNAGRVSETTATDPQSAYARSKVAAEVALAESLPETASLIVVRPANHSGAGQHDRFVIPAFAGQIALIEAGRAPPVLSVGNLEARRDFSHVADVVDAYILLLARFGEGRERLTVNVGSGRSMAVGELLDRLLAMTDASVRIVEDPARMRPSDVPVAEVDTSLLRRLTGWVPHRTIDEMLHEVLEERRRIVLSAP